MATPSTSRTTQASKSDQYHHFIPRFILRNFVDPGLTVQPAASGLSNKQLKNTKRSSKGKFKPQPPSEQLHLIDLGSEDSHPKLTKMPLGKIFGMHDMYKDIQAADQYHLEKKLSVLEGQAAAVLGTARKAFEAGQPDVWITRRELDAVRKFLFIMKYRNSTFYQRFYHETAEDYNANDRDTMLEYTRDKGFKKPMDVWFHNIEGILDLKMDFSTSSQSAFLKAVYPPDALWCTLHLQWYFLSFCTPKDPNDEFLLTENAFSIFEGPHSIAVDPSTSSRVTTSYTEFHVFAPLTPKLLLVLRLNLLPSGVEDADEEIRKWKARLLSVGDSMHNDPANAKSMLEDLPVEKARNSYSKVANGRLTNNQNVTPAASDKFCFRFFPISSDHVSKINIIMLEEAWKTSRIVFKTMSSACRAVEAYLGTTIPGFKIVNDLPHQAYMKKLELVAKMLGSNAAPVYPEQRPKPPPEIQQLLFEVAEEKRKAQHELLPKLLSLMSLNEQGQSAQASSS